MPLGYICMYNIGRENPSEPNKCQENVNVNKYVCSILFQNKNARGPVFLNTPGICEREKVSCDQLQTYIYMYGESEEEINFCAMKWDPRMFSLLKEKTRSEQMLRNGTGMFS